MNQEQTIHQLRVTLKRIFTLPLTRTSFREVQSAIMAAAEGETIFFPSLMESLLIGEVKGEIPNRLSKELFQKIIDEYCLPTRIAKEVHDKGQYVSFITSDIITQNSGVLFSNCIKTVEGEEMRFGTDVESSLQIAHHFIGRLAEAKRLDSTQEEFNRLKSALESLKRQIATL